ncbi:redoxin domain-containing protein [Nonomuraea roseola]|uniref:Redoxin domain-containing protein n=1 Tax=Nonomuraea roseola TaxID=46179 RepID=A0ABV5PRY1_9ACTN
MAGKPVVFWFWVPWCPRCRSEAPAVKAAAATYDHVAFVGVAGLDTEAALREFVQRTGTGDVTHLADAKGAVWTRLGVSEQPDGSTTKATGPSARATWTATCSDSSAVRRETCRYPSFHWPWRSPPARWPPSTRAVSRCRWPISPCWWPTAERRAAAPSPGR